MAEMAAIEASWYDYPQYYDLAFRSETRMEADFIEAACRKYCPFPRATPAGAGVRHAGDWWRSWRPGATR